jgi:hypothetical protein
MINPTRLLFNILRRYHTSRAQVPAENYLDTVLALDSRISSWPNCFRSKISPCHVTASLCCSSRWSHYASTLYSPMPNSETCSRTCLVKSRRTSNNTFRIIMGRMCGDGRYRMKVSLCQTAVDGRTSGPKHISYVCSAMLQRIRLSGHRKLRQATRRMPMSASVS